MSKVREHTIALKKKAAKEYEETIHKGLNDSTLSYDREISKLEKQMSEVQNLVGTPKKSQQQSTTDFLKMSFSPPKKDIVQMLTPQKEPISTAITPYKERQSTLDFLMGGTPKKHHNN